MTALSVYSLLFSGAVTNNYLLLQLQLQSAGSLHVAGSIILAAVLLKLGGYGMIRMLVILEPLTKELSYPFIIFAL